MTKIEENEGVGQPSRANAWEQARAFSQTLAKRRTETQASGPDEAPGEKNKANTGNNSTFANSNDSLDADNVTTNQVAGAGGAGAMIQAGRESGNSSGGNQQQGFTGSNDTARINAQLLQKEGAAKPVDENIRSLFDRPTTPQERVDIHQRVAMANAYNRPSAGNPEGQRLGGESLQVLKNMDASDVQSGLEALRQGPVKPTTNDGMPNQGDSFTP